VPELQSPDPGRKLQERYNLIGTTPAPFLSPELVPVVILDDLSQESPGVRFCTAGGALVGGVGENEQTKLSNGASSGVDITDIEIFFSSSANIIWELDRGGPALTSTLTSFFQDESVVGSPTAVVTLGVDVGATTGILMRGNAQNNMGVLVRLPNYVITPGFELFFICGTTNVSVRFFWTWGERDR